MPLGNDPEGDGVDLHALGLGCRAPGPGREKRYLPPGTVKDLWRTFCTRHSFVALDVFLWITIFVVTTDP